MLLLLKVATPANQRAGLCPPHTYSPGYSRLRSCFKCQSGMVEPVYFTSTTLRVSKTDVCGVPAGRYLSQNVVRDCPLGSFRSTWELAVDVNARYCYPCPPGITTSSAAATSFAACNGECTAAKQSSLWTANKFACKQEQLYLDSEVNA